MKRKHLLKLFSLFFIVPHTNGLEIMLGSKRLKKAKIDPILIYRTSISNGFSDGRIKIIIL